MSKAKRILNVIKWVVITLLVVGYAVYSLVVEHQQSGQLKVKGYRIHIKDSNTNKMITIKDVMGIIAKGGGAFDKFAIRQNISATHWVDSVWLYSSIDGWVDIHIYQSEARLRIVTNSGYDFYLDSTLSILPSRPGYVIDVPIISGDVGFLFPTTYYGTLAGKKYEGEINKLKKLLNFVEFISTDSYLSQLIDQIWIGRNWDLELTTKVGGAVVVMGDTSMWSHKLVKVREFYRQAGGISLVDSARVVDMSYRGQIVVKM